MHAVRPELRFALTWDVTECGDCSGRVVDLATNCYGCHVLQKALDCEEDIRLLIVSELLLGDPGATLVNKHASHVWSKVCFFQ